jgi:hypothetical protein
MEHLRRAMRSQVDEPDRSGAAGGDEPRGSKALMRARRALKSALADKWDSPAEEQDRIAGILRRAAEEISGKDGSSST